MFDKEGNAYVGAVDGDNDIRKFDKDGNALARFNVITGPRGSDWIDLATDQCTILYTSEGRQVKRFNACTNTQLPDFTAGLHGAAFALRILPDNGVLVADSTDIHRLDANGNIIQTYDAPGENCWFALNLDPNATSFWSGDFCTANFYKFNITTGAIELGPINTGTGSGTLFGLAVGGELQTGGPGKPVVVRATSLDSGVALSLAPATEADAAVITGYHIEIEGNGRTIVEDHPAEEDGTLSKVIRGLANGVSHLVKAFATDSQGLRQAATVFFVIPRNAPLTSVPFVENFPKPVLFVHGSISNGSTWDSLSRYLEEVGLKRETLELENDVVKGTDLGGSVRDADFYTLTFASDNVCIQSIELGKFLAAVRVKTGVPKVVVVGHSTGGLAARAYMQVGRDPKLFASKLGTANDADAVCKVIFSASSPFFLEDDIAKLVTYGTPHSGLDVQPITDLLSINPSLELFDPRGAFLRFLNNFTVLTGFPLPVSLPITNLRGKISKSASHDCIVSTRSQNMQSLDGFQAPGVFTNPEIPWRRHAGGLEFAFVPLIVRTCGFLALLRTAETKDENEILKALDAAVLQFRLGSPADLVIVDPNGAIISKDRREIWGANYEEQSDEGGIREDIVEIPFPQSGAYQVIVIPEPGAAPTDTFSLEVTLNGVTTVLAQNQKIQDIPAQGFTVAVSLPTIINDLVSFIPLNSTFKTTSDTAGCPSGFVGKFSFDATLSNTSSNSLSNLMAKVAELTNGNLLQNADGGPRGVGATLTVPRAGNFTDGVLGPAEFVDVPFNICLKEMAPFTFFVDVLGVAGNFTGQIAGR